MDKDQMSVITRFYSEHSEKKTLFKVWIYSECLKTDASKTGLVWNPDPLEFRPLLVSEIWTLSWTIFSSIEKGLG